MTNDADSSPVKPTVIDLDPDQVTVERDDTSSVNDAPADPPSPPPHAPAPKERRSSYGGLAFVAALVIGAIGGGWLYRDLLAAYFPSSNMVALNERVEGLGQGHEALTTQVKALERLTEQLTTDVNALEESMGSATAETKSVADGLAATKANVAALETTVNETRSVLATLSSQPSSGMDTTTSGTVPPDVAQRLAALEQDVAALKAQKTGALDKAQLTQTLSDLKAKIEAGTPFAEESDRISRMLPAASGLDVLAAHAATGLPTAKGLSTELAALKPSLPTPEIKVVPSEPGFWEKVSNALSSVITIRDLDAVNWQQVAEKAIAFADAGDLAQAVASVDEPEAALPAGLQQWRDRAAARIALEAALADVVSAAARVQGSGP